MRRILVATLAVAVTACDRSQAPPAAAITPQDCAYEIVQPDTSDKAAAFRAWLKANTKEIFDRTDVDSPENGDVFISNLDNDSADEFLFAWHEGSGSYLSGLVFRPAADKWSLVEHSPFEDQELAHEYAGPRMREAQLVARLCGKTILNFSAGIEPNYYPASLIWQSNQASHRHHRRHTGVALNGSLKDSGVILEACPGCVWRIRR